MQDWAEVHRLLHRGGLSKSAIARRMGMSRTTVIRAATPRWPAPLRAGLSIALGVQAARRGHRVAFATAHEWVQRLTAAQRAGRLDTELERLGRTPLLIIDEVGYIPFDPDAAALLFALISSRYERASMIVSSNKTSRPGPRSSAMRSPSPPSWTGSCTTPRSSCSAATATAYFLCRRLGR